jgi:pSer/pThr/pTyr-binding forkhead associated (FHA) protein
MWILRTPAADADPVTFRVPPGSVKTIGRTPNADFVLDVALVSRLHCRIVAADHTLDVEDLSSTNGTFVNGTRVERARLSKGDRLRLGRIELMVEKLAASPA